MEFVYELTVGTETLAVDVVWHKMSSILNENLELDLDIIFLFFKTAHSAFPAIFV